MVFRVTPSREVPDRVSLRTERVLVELFGAQIAQLHIRFCRTRPAFDRIDTIDTIDSRPGLCHNEVNELFPPQEYFDTINQRTFALNWLSIIRRNCAANASG